MAGTLEVMLQPCAHGISPWQACMWCNPKPPAPVIQNVQGCICPAGAETTCKGITCPRRGINVSAIGNKV